MKILEIADNNVKIFGWTILKIKFKRGKTKFYVLGLPIFTIKNKFDAIREEFSAEKSFDDIKYDAKINDIVAEYKNMKTCRPNPKRLVFLATKVYDVGGHTKWLRDMQRTLAPHYDETLFLTTYKTSVKAAPQTLDYLKKISKIQMFHQFSCSFEKNIREIYDSIVDYAPKALFVFIHPDDIIGTAVIALIKQHTKIKIFFVNHATHRPALALSFADLVLEETPSSVYVTQNLRKVKQTHIVGLISKAEEENPHFTREEIAAARKNFGVPQGAICTMSGAASYKFFDKDGSRYFEMIEKMLKEHPNVYHIVFSEFQDQVKEILHQMFDNSPVKDRLLLREYQQNYELAFKCADLFIDSFPMSSALAFIDLMRLKVPYVVKINTVNSALSFHEFQAKDFPYMYETVEQMYAGICDLLKNDKKRLAMVEKNYSHYMEKYEIKAAEKILQRVVNCDNFAELYDNPDKNAKYSLCFDD